MMMFVYTFFSILIPLIFLSYQDRKTHTVKLWQVIQVIPIFLVNIVVNFNIYEDTFSLIIICGIFQLIMLLVRPINRIDTIFLGLIQMTFQSFVIGLGFMFLTLSICAFSVQIKKKDLAVFPIMTICYLVQGILQFCLL